MNIGTPFTIISAERSAYTTEHNYKRSELLRQLLDAFDLPYRAAIGVWAEEKEVSYVINTETERKREKVIQLAQVFNQDAVLHVDSTRHGTVISLSDSTIIESGRWAEVSKHLNYSGYTETDDGRRFALV